MDSWTFFGIVFGALAASVPTIWTTYIRTRSEERRHYRDIVFKTAVANFEQACEMGRKAGRGQVMPLDAFLIHMAKLAEFISKDMLSEDSIRGALKQLKAINKVVNESFSEEQKSEGTAGPKSD